MRTLSDYLRTDVLSARIVPLAMVLILLPSLSGCSFLFVNGPPAEHQQMSYFSCTESDAGPILDVVWAGLNLAGTISIAADPDAYEDDWGLSSGSGIASGVAWTLLSGSAAFVGFNKTEDCRAAKRALAERQAQGKKIPPADTVRTDTARTLPDVQPDPRREPPQPEPFEVGPPADSVGPDTLAIHHSEYTNPWLTKFDFRSDREDCKAAIRARFRGEPALTDERFELLVRRCLSGKGWERRVDG